MEENVLQSRTASQMLWCVVRDHRLTVVGPVIFGSALNVFIILLNKYLDSIYYSLGTIWSAL